MKRQKGREGGRWSDREGLQNRAETGCGRSAAPQAHTPCPEPEQEPERNSLC